ncbi:MAG TPA: hypothetical protein VIO61_03835 [Anaerolineaceae bacterium]
MFPFLQSRQQMLAKRCYLLIMAALLLASLLAGCAVASQAPAATTNPPTPSATFTASPTSLPATPTTTPMPASPTPAHPSPTPTRPAPTATITSTPAPFALLPDGVKAWCLPPGVSQPSGVGASVPAGAVPATGNITTGLTLKVPASSCSFIFTFNQNIPSKLEIQVFDRSSAPWLRTELTPLAENPKQAVVTFTHTYIINPPIYSFQYKFILKTSEGKELANLPVTVQHPYQGVCIDGSYPDPITLRCPKSDYREIEPHPPTPTATR